MVKNLEPDDLPGLHGSVWLMTDDQRSLIPDHIRLLRAIADTGSTGISYKTAWDRVDALNNMSETPLVSRSAGGAHGGGTHLTPFGERILTGFASLQQSHQEFINRLSEQVQSLEDVARFMHLSQLQTSIRNQLSGRILSVQNGAVNCEVYVDVGIEQPLVIMISKESLSELHLQPGSPVAVLLDERDMMLSLDAQLLISARNRIGGHIRNILPGAVNCSVTLDIGNDKTLMLMITNASAGALALHEGMQAWAVFKASVPVLVKQF